MKYNNPVVKGFYPDPSVCKAEGKFYLACSSMQFYPGVPLFESEDLVNWCQIGHCLTRKSQVVLDKVRSSGGVFAPTIRYNDGRFYMVTNNNSTNKNYYVWTDDIYGEWSDPICVDQDGIDPDLYFEDGRCYFISNGSDDDGVGGVVQCEIEIETGKKLSRSRAIWQGSGGRYLEAPHMYKINGYYYLMAAEGGTEYGHMVTYARSKSVSGPFEGYAKNPVLTNRNLGGFEIQGVGHGDLVEDNDGNWWMVHLGFRQQGQYITFHNLGRETFLTPVRFSEDGWFEAGENGTTVESFDLKDIKREVIQKEKTLYTFANTEWDKDWCYLRYPEFSNYELHDDMVKLKGTSITLDDVDTPSFIGIRQKDFNVEITCTVKSHCDEAGITIYMDENHHYDIALSAHAGRVKVIEKINIGTIKSVENSVELDDTDTAVLVVKADNNKYKFYVRENGMDVYLGCADTRYISSEVAGGFTGAVIGLYAIGNNENSSAEFRYFNCRYLN